MTFNRKLLLILQITSALFAAWVFLSATEIHGVGIRTDSVAYLVGAENIADGSGYVFPNGLGELKPITHWPPLYPFILALFIRAGAPAETAARIFGALLIGATVWLFAELIDRTRRGDPMGRPYSIYISTLGVVLLLSAQLFWDTYYYAMTEPLFIVLTLLFFIFLDACQKNPTTKNLFLLGLTIGLGILTRFIGIYLLALAGWQIFILIREPFAKKIKLFAQVLIPSLLPVAAWSLRNYLSAGTVSNRGFSLTPISSDEVEQLINSLSNWFNPFIKMGTVLPLPLTIFIVILCLAFLIWQYKKSPVLKTAISDGWRNILATSIFIYGALLLLARIFFDPLIPLHEPRMFIPVYISLILLVVNELSPQKIERAKSIFDLRILYAILILSVLAGGYFTKINIQKSYSYFVKSRAHGLALNNALYDQREIFTALKNLGAPDAVYFADNVEKLYWGSQIFSAGITKVNAGLSNVVGKVLPAHDVYIVLLESPSQIVDVNIFFPTAERIYKGDDGAIFFIPQTP